LKRQQEIIDAIWVDNSLKIGEAQKVSDYIIIPGDISSPSSMDNKPRLTSEGPSASISANVPESSTSGRKRAATLTAAEPVAQIKRPGTPKAAQASFTSTIRGPASVADHQDEATPITHSLSGLFQIASENDTPAQKASRKYYIAQVVNELDVWCGKNYGGTRTAFLISKRKEISVSLADYPVCVLLMIQPEFDRVAFFSCNKKAILRSLSRRGRGVGLGSELYEGARRREANVVESKSSETSRPVESASSALRGPAASATPKSKRDAVLVAKPVLATASVAHTSSAGDATAPTIPGALRRFFLPSGELRRLGPLEAVAKKERQKLLLAYMVEELDQWCLNESPGSRYAFLAGMNASSPVSDIWMTARLALTVQLTFDRNRLFTENKEAILQVLERRGRQVHEGTKIYGESLRGPHKFVYNRRDGRETVLPQSTSTSASKSPAASRNTTNESSAQSSQLMILSRNDPAPLTTSPTTSAVGTTAANLSIPAPRRKRAPTISTPQTIKKESNLAQLIDELQVWCEGKSTESRTAFFQSITISKVSFAVLRCLEKYGSWHILQPGFDRAALFKRNRDYVLQALKKRRVDVSQGSKAYGTQWVKDKTFTLREKHKEDEETYSPRACATKPSGSSHAKLSFARPVFEAAASAASSSESFTPPVESVASIPQVVVKGQYNDPRAIPDDLFLLMPVDTWTTPDNK
jgi:hypothetical protein